MTSDGTELKPRDDLPEDEEGLVSYLVDLVEVGRRAAATQVNAALTMTNWLMGRAISTFTLGHGRADYGSRILATVPQQLSWSHLKEILPLTSIEARGFYIEQAVAKRLSVRELRRAISRKAFERREIANAQIPEGSVCMTATRSGTWKRRSCTTCAPS